MTTAAPPTEDPARVEIRYQHTTCRKVTVTAHDIREIFGLGGTPVEELIDRLVALLAARPSLLGQAAVEDLAEWELDCSWMLTTIAGMAPGDAAEHLRIAELAPLTSARVWEAEPDGREHERCGEDCSAHGQWAATRIMPSGHMWQWSDQAHTAGYLAHRTRP